MPACQCFLASWLLSESALHSHVGPLETPHSPSHLYSTNQGSRKAQSSCESDPESTGMNTSGEMRRCSRRSSQTPWLQAAKRNKKVGRSTCCQRNPCCMKV